MASPQTGTGFALTLERTIAAPPERVFDAFTKAETLSRWFGPSDDYTVTVTECDVRPGGRYRMELKHTGGNVHVAHGIYELVSRPDRLVFSFGWEAKPDDGMSRVTVTLAPQDTGTRLVLLQEQFPTTEVRDAHVGGWTGSFERLARLF